ncbi:unnamed protein product [Ranitomeya imitator]|uniref:Tetratricopeptide repeat protein 7 N-terminal domain-containing protein n=1 Tax=Ranitomeya imitator TaxID=111125 RepID=A0ABN9KZZ6_9NEOB|nr:unnamed protein product [Ranitomeya imitator]
MAHKPPDEADAKNIGAAPRGSPVTAIWELFVTDFDDNETAEKSSVRNRYVCQTGAVNCDICSIVIAAISSCFLESDTREIYRLSLERFSATIASRARLSEREEEAVTCFEKASWIAQVFLQELDKSMTSAHSRTSKSSASSGPDFEVSYFLEVALGAAYAAHFKRGSAYVCMGPAYSIFNIGHADASACVVLTLPRPASNATCCILLRSVQRQNDACGGIRIHPHGLRTQCLR